MKSRQKRVAAPSPEAPASPIRKVVLAYSGGLDTSVILKWLKERYACEVIAFCADLGQGEDLEAIKQKALAVGASKVYVEDLREIFVRDYVFPMLRANAIYEGSYLLGTAIARPLIARRQMEIAKREKAQAVSHGATGKGNDQVRFELTYLSHDPRITIIAPWREWEFQSRGDLIRYAQAHGIPVAATRAKPYSMDLNLFHISYEGGILEDPWAPPPESLFRMTTAPERAPNKPQHLEIEFERGNPVAVDGQRFSPAALLAHLNHVGGRHGIGRADVVENRYIGIKSRGVYETPGGTILHVAHRGLESITMDREVLHLRDSLIPRYAELVYYGYWFAPERLMLQRAFDEAQQPVSGTVRLKLYKGTCMVTGRRSPNSLYRETLATFEQGAGIDPRDAAGFIRLNALRLAVRSRPGVRASRFRSTSRPSFQAAK
ncbi:MAG: argininosuccinate synthase [Nitrospirae bacterium]|nr:MAG: argininosuccinate synthase [Nitrospirota bacterium]